MDERCDRGKGPPRVPTGGKVSISFGLSSTSQNSQRVLLDLRVHFVKASGKSSPKVFKLKAVELPVCGAQTFRKTISLAELTTRKHYAGRHVVEVLINGVAKSLGAFTVTD